jgi:hypothetical protein
LSLLDKASTTRSTGVTWIFPSRLKANSLRKKMPQQLVSLSKRLTIEEKMMKQGKWMESGWIDWMRSEMEGRREVGDRVKEVGDGLVELSEKASIFCQGNTRISVTRPPTTRQRERE